MNEKLQTSRLFTAIFITSCLIMSLTKISHSQTTYKKDAGFYTPILKSLYLRGGVFEDTQLIGPAVGYRFNKQYDLTLHAEFLSTEYNATNRLSMLNVGLILGRTKQLSDTNMLRSEFSVYHSFNLDIEGLPQELQDPSLTSTLLSISFYHRLGSLNSIKFLPNIGGFIGYGNYQPPYSTANLRQGFDGFVLGPRLGFDVSFELFDSFILVAKPEYRLRFNLKNDNSVGSLLFNIQLNL